MLSLFKRPSQQLEAALRANGDTFSIEGSSEPPHKKPRNSQDVDSLTDPRPVATAVNLKPEDPATRAAIHSPWPHLSDDALDPDELDTVEQLLAGSVSGPATPAGGHEPVEQSLTGAVSDHEIAADEFELVEQSLAGPVSDREIAADKFESVEQQLFTAPLSELATPADEFQSVEQLLTGPVSDHAIADEFESVEQLLTAPLSELTSSHTRRMTHNHADNKSHSGFYSRHAKRRKVETPIARPVAHSPADGVSPTVPFYLDVHKKSHGGQESKYSSAAVIDLTEDDGMEVPGTPGNRMKHGDSSRSPSVRRTLNPVPGNTPAPYYNWEDRKSAYLTPSKSAPGYAGMAYSSPLAGSNFKSENVGNGSPYYTGVTPSPGLVQGKPLKSEDMYGYNTPHQTNQLAPSPGQHDSPKPAGFDMTQYLINEQMLAAMPSAAQPSQLKTKLLPHQQQALHWMIGMEQQKEHPSPSSKLAQSWGRNSGHSTTPNRRTQAFSGGILADDMGLGKTLEMISLILTEHKSGPTLIVAPKGVLSNWESQIRRHIQWKHAPRLFRFHGSSCHVTPDQLRRNDIVITTYNKLGDEARVEGTLRRVRWRRVILDEGHTIRNPDSRAALAACLLQAKSRWACTGTPIINSEKDIHSLCKFIGANATLNKGDAIIARRLKSDHEFLQDVMTILCLRRTKNMSFINLDLPPKEEELVRVEFSEAEELMYQKLFEDAQAAAELFFKTRNYVLWNNLLERLLRLRQMCDHWTLCRKKDMDRVMENDRRELDELISASAGKPDASQLGELLRLSLEARMACGICNEPVDQECRPVIASCGHVFCRACIFTRLRKVSTCPVCNYVISTADVHEAGSAAIPTFEVPASNDHSAKTKALMGLVKERIQIKGSKVVVFSQWTSFLDIVSRQMDEEGIGHTRIDGTMSTIARDEAARSLQGDPNVRVMLASLRAAGVGISLVAADTVIVSDSWWAPAVEEQAVDRVHRLGQTRPTKVYRLVIKGAVEEGVIRIQDRKRELVGTAFQEDFKSLGKSHFADMIQELLY